MARPVLALGLIALAALLLGSLFATMAEQIADPEPFEPDVERLAKAAQTPGPHQDYLEATADASLLKLLEDAEITLPEGSAEWDGETLTLLEEIDWTLPAGTELDDLTLPVPPGTEIRLPQGTHRSGDTLHFPPGSELTLADGVVLELPEGGKLRIPGADAAAFDHMIQDGVLVVPESGAVFSAPKVTSSEAWPLHLPAGTTFKVPTDWRLPEGAVPAGTYTFPAGMEIAPHTEHIDRPAGQGSEKGLFERLGQMDLQPPAPKPQDDTGGTLSGGIPGGTAWLWALAGVALLVALWCLWHWRGRLVRLLPTAAGRSTTLRPASAPFRLIARIDDRPDILPLAVAPGETRTVHLRFEAKDRTEDGIHWSATPAQVTVHLGDDRLHDGPVPVEGVRLPLPPRGPGDHPLTLQVRIDGHRPARLDETLRVAPWAEQVARDYDRLAVAATERARLPHGFTPRILESRVAPHIPPAAHQPLAEALTVFEHANYGHEEIDETSWCQMAERVERLIVTLMPPRRADPQPPPHRAPRRTPRDE